MTLSTLFYAHEAKGLAIQSDGKVLISCIVRTEADLLVYGKTEFGLFRFNIDGSLDTSFSGDGIAMASFSKNSADKPNAIEVQPDGKIIVVGTSGGSAFAATRFNSDGSLDTGFGNSGMLTTNISSPTVANSVLAQLDGKIILAGRAGSNFSLARYNADGSLDTSFDGDGKLTTSVSSVVNGEAFGVKQQSDGKYIVIGGAYVSGNDYDFCLVRYNTNGTLDTSFGTDGKVTSPFKSGYLNSSGVDWGRSVALQPDGKILVAGYTITFDSDGKTNFAVARYNVDGSLDKTFGVNGQVITDFDSGYDYGYAISLQSDGKFLVSGEAQVGVNKDFAIARYNANGSLDSTFGIGGKVTYDIDYGNDTAYSVAIQSNSKIIISGNAIDSASDRSAIAWLRLNSDGSIDKGTGTSGNDSLNGSSGNDTVPGGGGDDIINGETGIDISMYFGKYTNYSITKTVQGYTVRDKSGTDGTDTLTSIERLQFSDKKIALDVTHEGNAGKALEFIGMLAFNKVTDKAIVGEIISYFDQLPNMHDICQLAISGGLTRALAGGDSSNAALAQLVFRNVVGHEASSGDVDSLVSYMDGRNASYSQADFLSIIAGIDLNQSHVNLVGLQTTGLEYTEYTL
jgi:uncharacterized delta-60 repeat protein